MAEGWEWKGGKEEGKDGLGSDGIGQLFFSLTNPCIKQTAISYSENVQR